MEVPAPAQRLGRIAHVDLERPQCSSTATRKSCIKLAIHRASRCACQTTRSFDTNPTVFRNESCADTVRVS